MMAASRPLGWASCPLFLPLPLHDASVTLLLMACASLGLSASMMLPPAHAASALSFEHRPKMLPHARKDLHSATVRFYNVKHSKITRHKKLHFM
jgi:hypothetical protein